VRWITPPAPPSLLVSGTLRPLIADYRRFYGVEEIDGERNRAFFSGFLAPSDDGMLIGAERDGELLGTPGSTGPSPRWSQPRSC
jgi:hypothetical protein